MRKFDYILFLKIIISAILSKQIDFEKKINRSQLQGKITKNDI